jgi:hypothetical protein
MSAAWLLGGAPTVMARGQLLRGFDQQMAGKVADHLASLGVAFMRDTSSTSAFGHPPQAVMPSSSLGVAPLPPLPATAALSLPSFDRSACALCCCVLSS